jgi:hypothetical protein
MSRLFLTCMLLCAIVARADTTLEPTSQPTTEAPTTHTVAPSTAAPTTTEPTTHTVAPSTAAPTTTEPTTAAPTHTTAPAVPSTAPPTWLPPHNNTESPTEPPHSTAVPTQVPTTAAPTAAPPTINPECTYMVGNLTSSVQDIPMESMKITFNDNTTVDLSTHLCGSHDYTFGNKTCSGEVVIGDCAEWFDQVSHIWYTANSLTITYSNRVTSNSAIFWIECDHSAPVELVFKNATNVGSYTFFFSSRAVCPGYVPEPASKKKLSTGAIIGIIIAAVAVAVIGVALFRYRSKSDESEYQRV